MSSDKNTNDNNKKKTISYGPLIVFGIINEIIFVVSLVLGIFANSNFSLKINMSEFSLSAIEKKSYLPIICILATIGFLFCIGLFYIVSYRILKREEKIELLEKIVTDENLTSIPEDKITTEKHENPLNPAVVTEKIDSQKYDSKSKVLISAIEAIKDL